jgi:hypothetical protein
MRKRKIAYSEGMLRNGKEVKVEIEYLSSDFIKHKHKISDVDMVICCSEDVKLKGVKVIALDNIFIPYWIEIWPKIDPMRKQFKPEELRFLVNVWNKKLKQNH